MKSKFCYRTNMGIVSMLVASRLELNTKEEVMWVIQACVPEEYMYGITSILVRAEVGKGLRCQFGEGIQLEGEESKFKHFIMWNDVAHRAAYKEEAPVGWESLKDFVREKEVEQRMEREAKKKLGEKGMKFEPKDY